MERKEVVITCKPNMLVLIIFTLNLAGVRDWGWVDTCITLVWILAGLGRASREENWPKKLEDWFQKHA